MTNFRFIIEDVRRQRVLAQKSLAIAKLFRESDDECSYQKRKWLAFAEALARNSSETSINGVRFMLDIM